MARFAGSLQLYCLSVLLVILTQLGGGSAMGLPRPPPNVNFTIGVEGAVWCKTCRYAGYVKSKDASPLPSIVLVPPPPPTCARWPRFGR